MIPIDNIREGRKKELEEYKFLALKRFIMLARRYMRNRDVLREFIDNITPFNYKNMHINSYTGELLEFARSNGDVFDEFMREMTMEKRKYSDMSLLSESIKYLSHLPIVLSRVSSHIELTAEHVCQWDIEANGLDI